MSSAWYEGMNGPRDLFALYAFAAATAVFFAVMHLALLHVMPPAVFAGDRLPAHVLITSGAPTERHSVAGQGANTLVKPAN